MFEHSLYEPETVAPPTGEGDFLHNYEIRNWELSPRIYKIIGISAIANILAILIVAQTSLLTMKGCDSPLVGGVCQVLDTVYVGAMLFGTDREYVDQVYEKTELADADITFVDVTGVTPPLSYPEGYFQIANPEQHQAMLAALNDPLAMGTFSDLNGVPVTPPSISGGSLLDTTPNLPPPTNKAVEGDLPSFGNSGVASNPRPRRPRRPTATPQKPDEDDVIADATTVAEPVPTPMTSDAIKAVQVNKKPLTDFADAVATKWSAKEIDLDQPFEVVLNGVITNEGKLDKEKSKFDPTRQKGDPKMIETAKAALEALGDSGFLTFLKTQGVDKIVATVTQDDQQIRVVISSTQKTPERANTVASVIGGTIVGGKLTVENPSDERTLLDAAQVTSNGKDFLLTFALPKPVAQEMIGRKLKEAQAKKEQQPKPSSVLSDQSRDNFARKQ